MIDIDDHLQTYYRVRVRVRATLNLTPTLTHCIGNTTSCLPLFPMEELLLTQTVN